MKKTIDLVKRYTYKKKNGITLIALIITIVVMLILATVTIGTINGGLFGYTKKAKVQSEIKDIKEQLDELKVFSETKIKDGTVNDILKIDSPYNDRLRIEDEKLVYIESKWTEKEIAMLEALGIISMYDLYQQNTGIYYYIANATTKTAKYADLTNVGTLENFRDMANAGTFTYEKAKLIEDIKLNEGKYTITNGKAIFAESATQWTPINDNFDATLEGNKFEISGLYINNSSSSTGNNMGLFSELNSNATINNLTIRDSYIKGYNNVGGFAGTNSGTINGCTSSAIVVGESNLGSCYGASSGGTFSGTKIDNLPIYTEDLLNASDVLKINTKFISGSEEIAIIPKGFAMSTNSNERTISGGLVIHDDDNNEFVWIPVKNGEFVRTIFDNNLSFEEIGEIEDDTLREEYFEKYKSSIPELSALDTYKQAIASIDGLNTWNDLINMIKTQSMSDFLENENNDPTGKYNSMVESVETFEGFYIGRYEAGASKTNPRTSASDELTDAIVQKGAYPYNCINWNNAVEKSIAMYSDSYSVVSTLCYGVQWDSVMRFIKDGSHNVNNSVTWGNYYNNSFEYTGEKSNNGTTWTTGNTEIIKPMEGLRLLQTGMSETNVAKNIFDLAGNIREWTMEAHSSGNRIFRGGYYRNDGSMRPASNRDKENPTNGDYRIGFRISIYIK